MRSKLKIHSCLPLKVLALSIGVVFAIFAWQGNKGFSLWDEGFLWYGAQRVMLGEVPIRDFMAYDPGRYYWSAAFMSILGDSSIMSLRIATAIFQILGLFTGLLLIAKTGKDYRKGNGVYLLLSAATLAVWMFPSHKLFDISISILLIGILTFLIEKPSGKNHFFVGVCIGLIAVFGRNHGVYGVVGTIGVMFWLSIRRSQGPKFLKGFLFWSAGIFTGYTPIFLMAFLIPGFALSFWESIRFLFEAKATNIALPVPWPWKVDFTSAQLGDAIRGILIGLFFIGIVLFGISSIIWVVYQKVRSKPVPPALVATSFLALPYSHYAYSRADVSHLAQGIFPLVLGVFILLYTTSSAVRWFSATAFTIASVWVMHIFHPGWQCYASKQCVSVEISGKNLQIDPETASNISLLQNLTEKYAPNGQSFVVVPFWPGAYPLFERKSPMWEIYALFPRSKTFEEREIERIRLAKPGFVFIFDFPLDGRDELRFKNTHPLTHQYILDDFEPIPHSSNLRYKIYKAKD